MTPVEAVKHSQQGGDRGLGVVRVTVKMLCVWADQRPQSKMTIGGVLQRQCHKFNVWNSGG